jgi:hypothetical protein
MLQTIKDKTYETFKEYIKRFSDNEVEKDGTTYYYDSEGRIIGVKGLYNYWKMVNYTNNKVTFVIDSNDNWEKRKYINGKIVGYQDSLGSHWVKK